MSSEKYNLEGIRQFVGEDEAAMKEMVGIFAESVPRSLQELNDGFEQNDLEKVGHYAHKLKSSIDILNIHDLKTDIRALEKLAKEKNERGKISPLLKKTNYILKKVLVELKNETSL
ncbi:MAG: Hpt domain-containing protein [Bacteroidales bacterium]|nr:Hpt domain-containing protein [Bacteroidales bacterium]MCF8343318.1 Hpt domain-containing protein [Bacteroidales bacterium]MCF8351863.1 Hpt domain-containing protein [Bacteroidales bacterium]MCF8376409.1 Hpt domain-containing protein [Bacteroidales bacterium]